MVKGKGRRRGSRNRGYYFKKERGWLGFDSRRRRYVPLEYETGERMRDLHTPVVDVKAAYQRLLTAPPETPAIKAVTVQSVCDAYLA
jgi:hypothetical protein